MWTGDGTDLAGQRGKQASVLRHAIVAVAALLTLAPGQAAAGGFDCGANGIGARFSEAGKLCNAGTGFKQAAADAAPAATPASVSVAEQRAVSVSMPGYRRRLAAAVKQVKRRGGTAAPDALVVAVGRQYRIDPHLLAAMVTTESAGNPNAVSHKGALGLMQVMPGTARSMGVRDPKALLGNRALALATGAAYLKHLQGKFGNNVPLVVAAYNAGPGAVQKYKGVPRYRETQGYVRNVMGRYVAARGAAQ